MRFATFSTVTLPHPHLGLVRADEILDIDLAGRAINLLPPDQMLDLIDQYEQAEPLLQAIVNKAGRRCFADVRTFSEIGAAHLLSEVTLHAPIVRPRKNIMCMAQNYAEHARETAGIRGNTGAAPTDPVFFTKAPTTINGPYDAFIIEPSVSSEIDWEAELGVIIGKGGKNIPEVDALSHVFGYTVINDITARDLQARHKQYFKGKSLDGSCPIGPWIVTRDEIADPQQLSLRLRVNGVVKQDGHTSQMIFPVAHIIAVLSLGMTLEPGDIIATGTPSGVGFSRKPPEFLRSGDVMETEIEGIGMLRNTIASL